jgi:hypothetical protein
MSMCRRPLAAPAIALLALTGCASITTTGTPIPAMRRANEDASRRRDVCALREEVVGA